MARTRNLLAALLLPGLLAAQEPAPAEALPADDPVLAQLDALAILPWLLNDPFTADTASLNVHGFAPHEVPAYDERIYAERLAILDHRTPFSLTYNRTVQAYIDLYAQKRREQTSRMLGLAELYFPVFEEALDRHDMPMELKYLAVVESALNPAARSRAGATGLWQFMTGTGKLYGLHVDSYVDERHDVYKSTEAACRYLKDLHGIFGDWELALAAYNCGPGNVNKAIRRSGGKRDYWEVYAWLPRETRGYVPAFIAVNYIMAHAADHNLYPVAPTYCAYEMDTVQVCYPLELADLAKATGTTAELLQELNPTFKRGLVPDPDQPVALYVPRDVVVAFLAGEDSLRYAWYEAKVEAGEALATAPREVVHIVRRGESLGLIAQRNGVTVSQLKHWNGLRSDRIQPGQRLRIEKEAPVRAAAKPAKEKAAEPVAEKEPAKDAEYIYHTIQNGDTLWDIANKYPGVSVEDLKRLNSDLNFRRLSPGKKIRVGVQQG